MPHEYEISIVLGHHTGHTIKTLRPDEFVELPAELPSDPSSEMARFENHVYKLERLRVRLKDGFREIWVYVPIHADKEVALRAALARDAEGGQP